MMGYVVRTARHVLSATAVLCVANAPAWAGPEIAVEQGMLEGRQDGLVTAFLGIPFAAPPVGKLRWRAPQPAPSWTGVRSAKEFGASCMQPLLPEGRAPWTAEYVVHNEISEDCLSLNIWTPAKAGAKKPVLVWIHGGGFNEGSGSVPIYNGSSLAGRDLVVVSVNYRLGAFGFLAHPEVTKETRSRGEPSSNFGLQDQIASLKWIQQNIAAFGGDPANVTIAGQSAGAMAVHSLVCSPLAKGLFSRAIAQSGLPTIIPMPTLSEAEKNGVEFAAEKGAKTLAQMRNLPANALVISATNTGGLRFVASIDGSVLPSSPADILARSTCNDLPMIVGQTADEGSAFPGYGSGDPAAFQAFMVRSFGTKAETFQRFYPASTEAERSASIKAASRDRGRAMIDHWADVRATKGSSPVFTYYFAHAEPGEGSDRFAAFHSSEIPYALATLDAAPKRNFSLADRQLSLVMSSYWVNFVKTGNPNGAGLVNWPAVSKLTVPTMVFGQTVAAENILPAEKLSAYRAYVAQGGKLSMF